MIYFDTKIKKYPLTVFTCPLIRSLYPMNDIQQKHVSVLTEHVFDVRKSWPQFRLLLNDIVSLSDKFGEDHTIAALERTILYGGFSLFAPIFTDTNFISVDCSPESAEERGPYNSHLIDHEDFVKSKFNIRCKNFSELPLPTSSVDLLLIPI